VLVGVNLWSIAMLAAGIVLHVHAQVTMHRIRDERRTGAPIANGVRALVLYCLAMTVANTIEWTPFLVAFYALFELALRLRPRRAQV
jgi:hypothetical protein